MIAGIGPRLLRTIVFQVAKVLADVNLIARVQGESRFEVGAAGEDRLLGNAQAVRELVGRHTATPAQDDPLATVGKLPYAVVLRYHDLAFVGKHCVGHVPEQVERRLVTVQDRRTAEVAAGGDDGNADAAGDERKQWCIGEHDAGAM